MGQNRDSIIIAGIALLIIFFFIDLITPLGVADGMLYVAVVLLSIWTKNKKYTLYAACIGILFTIIGYFMSPVFVSTTYIPVVNRFLAIGVILACAFIISKYKEAEGIVKQQQKKLLLLTEGLKKSNAGLEERVQARTMVLKEALEELEKSRKNLNQSLQHERELNELKTRFVSMASHEFRTPLATILSSLTLVTKYSENGEREKQLKHIQRIKSSVTHLTDLLNDVLSVSKLEEGKIPYSIERFNIAELSRNIVLEVQGIAKDGQYLDYLHSGNEIVFSDPKIFRHILLNLVSNAIKFTPTNKTIRISTCVEEENIELKVEDQGIGISEEDQRHLFERFFRGENAANIQGTGLGLNIVGKYVELMDGGINFSSKINEGTTFIVHLPDKAPTMRSNHIPAPIFLPPST